jgi:hypothetical protein
MDKKPITNPVLFTWVALNESLGAADEELCWKLLDEEKKGRNRPSFIKRVHSRLNKVRADRERKELGA